MSSTCWCCRRWRWRGTASKMQRRLHPSSSLRGEPRSTCRVIWPKGSDATSSLGIRNDCPRTGTSSRRRVLSFLRLHQPLERRRPAQVFRDPVSKREYCLKRSKGKQRRTKCQARTDRKARRQLQFLLLQFRACLLASQQLHFCRLADTIPPSAPPPFDTPPSENEVITTAAPEAQLAIPPPSDAPPSFAEAMSQFSAPSAPPKASQKGVGYNSALLVDPSGELVGNYRKAFLYDADRPWALEGPGFRYFDLPQPLGRTVIGVCMGTSSSPFVPFIPSATTEIRSCKKQGAVSYGES